MGIDKMRNMLSAAPAGMAQGDMQNRDLVAQTDIPLTGEASVDRCFTDCPNAHEKYCFSLTVSAGLF